MSFPKDSAFGQHQRAMDQAAGVVPTNIPSPVRHVGRPNIVEIPLDVLESWIGDLWGMDKPGEDDLPMIHNVVDQMRSYLRG